MAFGPTQDKASAARPVCFVPAIGYEGRVNAPSLHIEDAAPDRRGRSLLDADPGPSVLVVLLLAILAVRIIALAVSHAELFFDEAQYWAWGQEPAFGYYTKPPLIAWIIGATTSLCGDAPFCVRLHSPLILETLIYPTVFRAFPSRFDIDPQSIRIRSENAPPPFR